MATRGVISPEERTYLISGIQQNFRTDGRSCNDYSHFSVETELVSSANGSAEAKMGKTHVLVGIKAELGEPKKERPASGRLEFFVDCTANASPLFERRGGESLALELSSSIEQMIHSSTLNLESLCVIPGKACWVLYIDALILECGGNLFDTLSLAVKAALFNTELPKLEISGEAGEVDFDVLDDQYDVQTIDVSRVPLIVTVNKIGSRFVLDATAEEEACCDAKLLVAVNGAGRICGMRKLGVGGLNPDLTIEMIETAETAGRHLNESLMKALNQEGQKRQEDQMITS
eukprot:gene3695-4213_t